MPEQRDVRWEDIERDTSFEYGDRYGVSAELGSENIRCSVIRFYPGDRGPLHYHDDPIEEYYVILDGKIDIVFEDETLEAEEGRCIFTPPGVRHYPHNTYETPAVILSVTSPSVEMAGMNFIEDWDEE